MQISVLVFVVKINEINKNILTKEAIFASQPCNKTPLNVSISVSIQTMCVCVSICVCMCVYSDTHPYVYAHVCISVSAYTCIYENLIGGF